MVQQMVIITGASSGIGEAIYGHLRKRLPSEIKVLGVSRRGPDIQCDLVGPDGVAKLMGNLPSKRQCSLLVNCAGILSFDEFADTNRLLNLNFMTPFYLMSVFEQDLIETKGQAINIASVSGLVADPETPLYGATKAALISLTKSFAMRWAGGGGRCNVISPGFFETNLVPGAIPDNFLSQIPLGFASSPAGILPTIDMLLDSPYITGANIVVDGGVSLLGMRSESE